jgi:putative FmdB family regulatory protein
MPIYEYRCKACKKVFEVIQKAGEGPDDVTCPSCSAKHPEKLISSCCAPSSGAQENATGTPSCGSRRFS